MRNPLLLIAGLVFSIAGCDGNVNVGSGGTGGNGGAGGNGGTTTTTTTTVPDDFTACSGPGQCVLALTGCCYPCGVPEIDSFAAVNDAKLEAYQKSVCSEPETCPKCATGANPNLFAYCDAGKCVAADVRTHAVSACTNEGDCRLRAGTGCCEPCGSLLASDLTAVSNGAMPSLGELVCLPDAACPACAGEYPPETLPWCGVDGHCEVVVSDEGN